MQTKMFGGRYKFKDTNSDLHVQEGSKCVLYTFRYLSDDQDILTSFDDVERNNYLRFNSFFEILFLSNPSSNPSLPVPPKIK